MTTGAARKSRTKRTLTFSCYLLLRKEGDTYRWMGATPSKEVADNWVKMRGDTVVGPASIMYKEA